MSASQSFPRDAAAPGAARSFVDSVLSAVVDDDRDAVRLMVSELAANSVRHAQTPFRVTVDQSDRQLRIAVDDSGPGTPSMQAPPPDRASGRGLQIVESLSDAWGVDHQPDGTKSVWFTLTLAGDPVSDVAALHEEKIGTTGGRGAPPSARSRASRPGRQRRAGPQLSSR